jgi:hypothetical protein
LIKFLVSIFFILSSFSGFAKTSPEERAELDYQIALSYGVDYKMPLTQLMVSKFLKQDHVLGLKIGKGAFRDQTQTDVALQYKIFTSSTFYIAPEIFYLNWQEPNSGETDDKITGLGAQFRIGNQWQWKHLSLGVDWIGLGSTLVYFNYQAEDTKEIPITLTELNAYIAYSF